MRALSDAGSSDDGSAGLMSPGCPRSDCSLGLEVGLSSSVSDGRVIPLCGSVCTSIGKSSVDVSGLSCLVVSCVSGCGSGASGDVGSPIT